MAARGCYFEGAFGTFLSLDVFEVIRRCLDLAHPRLRARQELCASEMVGELNQRGSSDDLHVRARPGGFRSASCRADQAFGASIGADRGRQDAGDGGYRPVEAEFA